MRALLVICAAALLGVACANDRPQRAPDMDPTSADAAPGEVVVPTALKPTPPANDEPETATVTGHDHGAMARQGSDAGSAGHDSHAAGGARDAGTVAAAYACPMHPEVQQNEPGRCPKCGMNLVQQKPKVAPAQQIYSCPMHPEVRQSEPGKCPKCGMKLVVEATDAGTSTNTSADSPSGKVKTPPAKETEKEKSSQLYTCPMHPEFETKDPKERCPKCGMKLVPKKADADASKDSAHGGHEGH